MPDQSIKIDGLTRNQFTSLLSPVRDIVNKDGSLSHRKVALLVHGMNIIANFFMRIFTLLFVSHKWESDYSLQQHLWKDLTDTDSSQKEKIEVIRNLFQELLLRIPGDDPINQQIALRLTELQSAGQKSIGSITKATVDLGVGAEVDPDFHSALPKEDSTLNPPVEPSFPYSFTDGGLSPFQGMIQKLNHVKTRAAEKYEIRKELIQKLHQENIAALDAVLLSLQVEEDRVYLTSYAKIMADLGEDNPLLEDFGNIEKIQIINSAGAGIGDEVRVFLLSSLGEEVIIQDLNFVHILGLLSSIDKETDKQHLRSASTSLKNKAKIYFEPFSLKLSGANPFIKKEESWLKVYLLNHKNLFPTLDLEAVKLKFLDLLGHAGKPEWKDEMIGLIEDKELQKELRIKSGILKEGDVVCRFSQGLIEEIAPFGKLSKEDGKNACASICAEAILYMVSHDKKTIETEDEMYQVMQKGVLSHKTNGFSPKAVVFSDVVAKMNIDKERLAAFAPKPPKDPKSQTLDSFAQERYEYPLMYPFQFSSFSGGHLSLVESLSDETGKRIFGVITSGNETVMVYRNADSSYSLFDSHGKSYLGVSKGASIRRFETLEPLQKHLEGMYGKGALCSMFFVGAA